MRPRSRILTLLALFAALSCGNSGTAPTSTSPWDLGPVGPALSVVPTVGAVCGTTTVTPLIADETVRVGSVEVANDGSSLYVSYQTDQGWPIGKTAVWVGASIGELPVTGGGNPQVGQFPYTGRHEDGTTDVVWQISLDDLDVGEIVIAAFAEVGKAREGAWGDGTPISDVGNWSTYFTHQGQACAAETVGSDGGAVATPGDDASIEIPAGALAEPTDITIEPATVDDLPEDTPTLYGVTPIPGSVWDFGPSGTTFDSPATVTIHYDEAALPPDTDESLLGLYVLNGIFDAPVSIVDVDANTVTGPVSHFSHAFVGSKRGGKQVDLAVSSVVDSPDPADAGQDIVYTVQVMNASADGTPAVDGATLDLDAAGNASFQGSDAGCSEGSKGQVSCPLPTLAPGVVQEVQMTLKPDPGVTGLVVGVRVSPPSGYKDPVPENDFLSETTTISLPEADLAVLDAVDSPDPVDVRVAVTYTVQVINASASGSPSLDGATLSLDAGSDAAFQAGDAFCTDAGAGAVSCALPTLAPGDPLDVQVSMLPTPGVSSITLQARVDVPAGFADSDPANNTATETTTVTPIPPPPAGKVAYVATSDGVSVVALDAGEETDLIPLGRLLGLKLTPDHSELWVDGGSLHITRVSTADHSILGIISYGARIPADMAFSPDGSTAWVVFLDHDGDETSLGAGELVSVDIGTMTVGSAAPISGINAASRVTVAATATGDRVYVSTYGQFGAGSSAVVAYDPATSSVLTTVQLGVPYLEALVASPDGSRVHFMYVVPQTATNVTKLRTLETGSNTFAAEDIDLNYAYRRMVLTSDGNVAYVGRNNALPEATRVDLVGRTVTLQWTTTGSSNPSGSLALSPDDASLAVRTGGPVLTRIDLATGSWLDIPLSSYSSSPLAEVVVR